jgi:hypothetical protein
LELLIINQTGGHSAALEELSTHDPIFKGRKRNGLGARPVSSQEDPYVTLVNAKKISTIITTNLFI